MKKTIIFFVAVVVGVMSFTDSYAQLLKKIDKATTKGKVVFLIVSNGITDLTEANRITLEAKEKVSKAEIITLNKSDNSNLDLVEKYGLSEVQAPMILVIATNGVVCGGYFISQATPEKLIDKIPTKKQADVLLAFYEGKTVFVVVSKKTIADKNKTLEECEKACAELKGLAVVVEIDLEDESEVSYIKTFIPNMQSTKTNVFVYNSLGQFNGKLEAPVSSIDLVNTAKKVSKLCCPGTAKKPGC